MLARKEEKLRYKTSVETVSLGYRTGQIDVRSTHRKQHRRAKSQNLGMIGRPCCQSTGRCFFQSNSQETLQFKRRDSCVIIRSFIDASHARRLSETTSCFFAEHAAVCRTEPDGMCLGVCATDVITLTDLNRVVGAACLIGR